MTQKVRKQIYLEAEQEVLLKRLSRQLDLSEAEIIRRAVSSQARSLVARRRDAAAWEREREFIHRLIEQGPVPGGRRWKREDVYDR